MLSDTSVKTQVILFFLSLGYSLIISQVAFYFYYHDSIVALFGLVGLLSIPLHLRPKSKYWKFPEKNPDLHLGLRMQKEKGIMLEEIPSIQKFKFIFLFGIFTFNWMIYRTVIDYSLEFDYLVFQYFIIFAISSVIAGLNLILFLEKMYYNWVPEENEKKKKE